MLAKKLCKLDFSELVYRTNSEGKILIALESRQSNLHILFTDLYSDTNLHSVTFTAVYNSFIDRESKSKCEFIKI